MAESDFEQLELASPSGLADFVPAFFADGLEQAERLARLLEARRIPALIEAQDATAAAAPALPSGIPVLVPAEAFDEATEFLAALEEDEDDEYDDLSDDDEDDDLDDDLDDLDDDYDDDEDDDEDDDDYDDYEDYDDDYEEDDAEADEEDL